MSNISESIGERIRKARKMRGLSQRQLADLVGVSNNAISLWEKGHNKKLDFARIEKLAEVLGVSTEWLIHGIGKLEASKDVKELIYSRRIDKFLKGEPVVKETNLLHDIENTMKSIPVYEGYVGAGGHGYLVEPKVAAEIHIPRLIASGWKDPFIIKVAEGQESMLPTIPPGAYVIINRNVLSVRIDRIYLVRDPVDPEGLMLKRIEQLEDGSLKLISDNPEYPPQVIKEFEDEPAVNMIIGVVVGVIYP